MSEVVVSGQVSPWAGPGGPGVELTQQNCPLDKVARLLYPCGPCLRCLRCLRVPGPHLQRAVLWRRGSSELGRGSGQAPLSTGRQDPCPWPGQSRCPALLPPLAFAPLAPDSNASPFQPGELGCPAWGLVIGGPFVIFFRDTFSTPGLRVLSVPPSSSLIILLSSLQFQSCSSPTYYAIPCSLLHLLFWGLCESLPLQEAPARCCSQCLSPLVLPPAPPFLRMERPRLSAHFLMNTLWVPVAVPECVALLALAARKLTAGLLAIPDKC